MISKNFAYDGLTVRVECPDAAHLTWLDEFLSPAFSPADTESADWLVTLEVDDRRHAELWRAGAQPGGSAVRGFVLDRGAVDLPLWASTGPERVLFDPETEVFYFVDQEARRIRIVSTSRYMSRRLALMRVVRELAMSSAWTRTRFVLHAAACESANAGIIIGGAKGAGKTTLLMHALAASEARFMANDRVVVDFDGSHAIARGMPTVITVRERTLRRFPAFAARWESSGYNERLAIHEAREHRASESTAAPTNLTPAQFCALLGVHSCGSAPARAILFPRLTDDSEGIHLQELPPEIALERLSASIFAAPAPQISQLFATPAQSSPPDMATIRELSRALVAQVRSFDCVVGQPVPHIAQAIREFVGSIA